jgi:hypothetical protein
MKGADSKNIILKKLMEVFPGSFMDDKVLRIPMTEGGEPLEIKVALTCAKDLLGDAVAASAFSDGGGTDTSNAAPALVVSEADIEPTEDEKANVAKMLESLKLDF